MLYALAGFVLAPWLVQRQLLPALSESLQRNITIDSLAINPFALSVDAQGVKLADTDGSAMASIARLYANVQLRSVYRRTLILRELRVEQPSIHLVLQADGQTNFHNLISAGEQKPSKAGNEPLFPVLIEQLSWQAGELEVVDNRRPQAVTTRISPISLHLEPLTTLANTGGKLVFEALSGHQTRVALAATVQLNPLLVEGEVQAGGGFFPLLFAHVSDKLNGTIPSGDLALTANYHFAHTGQGLAASVTQLNLGISKLQVRDGSGAEVIALPQLQLANLNLAWPEQKVSAHSLRLEAPKVFLAREKTGGFNLQQLLVASPQQPAPDAASAADKPWQLQLAKASIRDMAVRLEDHTLAQTAVVEVADLDLDVADISNSENQSMPVSASVVLAGGGELATKGQLTLLPRVAAEMQVQIADLPLALAQPYLAQHIRMTLETGAVAGTLAVVSNGDEPFAVAGQLGVKDLHISQTGKDRQLLGWEQLTLTDLAYNLRQNHLDIGSLDAVAPYIRLRIDEDNTTNFEKLLLPPQPSPEPEPEPEPKPQGASTAQPFGLAMGEIRVRAGVANFADRSLPIPFKTTVANIEGTLSTIDTASAQPTRIKLEGQVDDYGLARVRGTLLPTNATEQADINVQFRNLVLPNLTPYSLKFAGREIADGRLNLDLHYRLAKGKLLGDNKIVISDLRLGKKVPQEGALDLPLELALALLRDSEGKIDIDLPVAGDTNNPEFRLGGVIGKALVTLVTKAVTAPFRLLANLVGMSSEDFERIAFEPGEGELTPPELEKIAKLADALGQRPQLGLSITPVADGIKDVAALQQQRVEADIAAALDLARAEGGKVSGDGRLKALEQLFTQAYSVEALATLRINSLEDGVSDKPEDRGEQVLNASAYQAALLAQLMAAKTVAAAELDTLAFARAEAVRSALQARAPGVAQRLAVGNMRKTVKAGKQGLIAMKLKVESVDSPAQKN